MFGNFYRSANISFSYDSGSGVIRVLGGGTAWLAEGLTVIAGSRV